MQQSLDKLANLQTEIGLLAAAEVYMRKSTKEDDDGGLPTSFATRHLARLAVALGVGNVAL